MEILKKNSKKVILILLSLLPILFEFTIFNNIKFAKNTNTLMRFLVQYSMVLCIGIYFLLDKFKDKVNKVIDFIYKYRYLIGLIIFVILVTFNLNFSSIGMWSKVINGENNQNITLIGFERSIRSDEWLVQTPFFLAQAMNDKFYPLYNQNVRYDGQNMLMVYPAPVLDITLIAKPMNLRLYNLWQR